ncbi:hypothetical protein N9K77_00745 [bacterium]|nr:hypothetical protein [bacterium]MDA8556717.1 hypothetical protein [bacterium]
MKTKKKILIAPLDWGLGHISRTISIIKLLQERGHEVITCGNNTSYNIYKKEFSGRESAHIIIKTWYILHPNLGDNKTLSVDFIF